jgi:hypothetical protein
MVIFLSVCIEGILQFFTNFYLHRKVSIFLRNDCDFKAVEALKIFLRNYRDCIIPCKQVPPRGLKNKKISQPTTTPKIKSKNCDSTIQRVNSAAVGRIKGIPIHPLKGSCSGYRLIPYFHQSHMPRRR